MINNSVACFLDDKNKWLVLFIVTYLLSFYWLPSEVPLFYSLSLPEEKLVSKYYLLIIPVFIYIFFLLTSFFSRLALKNENMLSLIKLFRVGLSAFSYFIFIKIILLII